MRNPDDKIPTVKEELLKKSDKTQRYLLWANVFLGVATVSIAWATVDDAFTNRKDVASHRPYIAIKDINIARKAVTDVDTKFIISAYLRNVGGRATAPGATISAYAARVEDDELFMRKPNTVLVPQEIVPGSPDLIQRSELAIPTNDAPEYLLIKITYGDDILDDDRYDQLFYFEWSINEPLKLIRDVAIWKTLADHFQNSI